MFLTFVRLLLARPGEFETEKKLKASVKASVAEGGIHIAEIGAGQVKKNRGGSNAALLRPPMEI